IFTGGNSKNGPEYFFRKQLKENGLSLEVVSEQVPRIHRFVIPSDSGESLKRSAGRIIKTISLTAPSGAANRAVGSLASYKELKNKNPDFNTFDFRVMQYRPFF
ncbi:MAG: uracil-DNA glycosylase family protein, partial [Aurantibacter sp.]